MGAGRLAVRTAGELLLTLGALVLLFVLWQLVWTDVTAAQTQRGTVQALQQRWQPVPAARPAEEPGDAPAPPAAPVAVEQDPATAPVAPEPGSGEAFALVHVPRFGDAAVIGAAQGVGLGEVLNDGVLGHYPGTAMPGAVGNAAFAGHRTTYGRPLARIDELQPGDPLVVEQGDAWYVYRVTGASVVAPDRVEVIAPVPGDPGAEPTRRLITLTACHPEYSARQRYVVHGELESWQPRSAGVPAALTGSAPAPAAG